MDHHPGLRLPEMLRRCSWCGEAEKPSKKLKKCAACEYALYCSKDCQRSAWDDHKDSCRYMAKATKNVPPAFEAEVRYYGFPNTMAFSRAMNDWIEAHLWALQSSTQAFILRLGGIRFLKNPPVFMMSFDSACLTKPGQPASERNPATTFAVRKQGLIKIDEWNASHPTNAQFLEGTAAERELLSVYMEERCGSAFACLMVAVFKCRNVTMSNTMNFPILHVRKRLPLDKASIAIVDDINTLCTGSINTGFPLRCVESQQSELPLPGRFVRKAGKWVWEALFADWDDYSATSQDYAALHPVLASLESGLSPKELLTAFLKL
ncbi:hypothetical protein C8Q79DRAFT_999710 [Trametes meyenii]|nr:hypothetical protein C8Q79DRAFT_999710 [Trametes meyenii]